MATAVLKVCPICQKMAVEKYRPFCSARCADVDLGRWLTESYSVPAEESAEMEDESGDENA